MASRARALKRRLAAGGLRRCKDAVPDFLLGRRLLRRRHGDRRAPQDRQSTERRDLPGHHLLRSITIPSSCSGVRGSSRDPLGNLFACSRYDTTSIYAPVPRLPGLSFGIERFTVSNRSLTLLPLHDVMNESSDRAGISATASPARSAP